MQGIFWAVRSGRPLRRIASGNIIHAAAFSPDGTRAATPTSKKYQRLDGPAGCALANTRYRIRYHHASAASPAMAMITEIARKRVSLPVLVIRSLRLPQASQIPAGLGKVLPHSTHCFAIEQVYS